MIRQPKVGAPANALEASPLPRSVTHADARYLAHGVGWRAVLQQQACRADVRSHTAKPDGPDADRKLPAE
jgi:hypothetical protein